MKLILNGKELKCVSFNDLKPGDALGIGQSIYLKTNQGQLFNLCTGALENYGGQPIATYPEAVLLLDPKPCCVEVE